MFLVVVLSLASCGPDVNSDDEARVAYLGIDRVASRVLALGFAGFNAADSANIPTQQVDADETGEVIVTGQVDQGNSDNKGMRLSAALVEYNDGPLDDPETDDEEAFELVYDTEEDAPFDVDFSLRDIPNGTLSGTINGRVIVSGDLEGGLDLAVDLSGEIEEDDGDTVRTLGSTTVTGTATNDAGGVFEIDAQL